jgi:hypothetical protein
MQNLGYLPLRTCHSTLISSGTAAITLTSSLQNRPNQLLYLHLQYQLYSAKEREEKSARGRTKRLNLRRQAGWQSRNLANEASDVIGLGLFRANPYLEMFGVGTSEVNVYIRGSL